MTMTKTTWFWWWGWKPEKVENWLEEMEGKGWNLNKIELASLRFKFTKGEPRKIRYCVDFQSRINDQYLTLFKDDHWELAWSGAGGWYIWKKEYVQEKPDIYTDNNSLIDRNKRLIWLLSPLTALLVVIFFTGHIYAPDNEVTGLSKIVAGVYIAEFALLSYGLFQLFRSNKKLIKNKL